MQSDDASESHREPIKRRAGAHASVESVPMTLSQIEFALGERGVI